MTPVPNKAEMPIVGTLPGLVKNVEKAIFTRIAHKPKALGNVDALIALAGATAQSPSEQFHKLSLGYLRIAINLVPTVDARSFEEVLETRASLYSQIAIGFAEVGDEVAAEATLKKLDEYKDNGISAEKFRDTKSDVIAAVYGSRLKVKEVKEEPFGMTRKEVYERLRQLSNTEFRADPEDEDASNALFEHGLDDALDAIGNIPNKYDRRAGYRDAAKYAYLGTKDISLVSKVFQEMKQNGYGLNIMVDVVDFIMTHRKGTLLQPDQQNA